MNKWDEIYDEINMSMWEPQQSIVQFSARFMKRRTGYDTYEIKREGNKVLDIGCGNGAVVHFFAKQGFETYGLDISEKAIELAKDYLEKEKLNADLKVASCDDIPYEDNLFDSIVCFGVLDHIRMDVAKKTIEEVKRVLKKGSLVFMTLCSTKANAYGKGEKVDKNTYILEEGHEKGEIQHYFDLEEIQELFKDFRIIDLRHSNEELYDVDALKPRSNFARWFVTCELKE